MTELGVGGGCHWCTEAVMAALGGVTSARQGFIASDPPHDSLSEAALVTFEEDVLPLGVLLEVHLRTHAATSDHSMRGKYRSAVYCADETLARRCAAELDRLQGGFGAPLVTRVLTLRRFEASPPEFRDYYRTRPEAPFCRTYIDPKLALLRSEYARHLERAGNG